MLASVADTLMHSVILAEAELNQWSLLVEMVNVADAFYAIISWYQG